MTTVLDVECALCGRNFKRERRQIHGVRVFCCRSHCVAFYSRERNSVKEHGTYGSYRKGCRCDPCKKANTDRSKTQRKRFLPLLPNSR